ncbi:ATP-binding protein [Paenisporosarcina sp. FSL H8-0542]|uniref:ATP-binding protein n=1 Tax=Paenisporosarcina sp. FSL H8-0542 TaxID=2921401 RepID=UPI00315B2B20
MGIQIPILSYVNDINITEFSSTLPDVNANEIERENIIKNIEDTFSKDKTCIMIEGLNATGKSTLLAQFVRRHKSNCVSFFIGDDYWRTNVSFFLKELCLQMAAVSSDGLKNKIIQTDIELLQEHELIGLFSRLYTDLCKQSKRGDKFFYIVIDGLEKLNNNNINDGILKYIPNGDPNGVYVLLSSQNNNQFALNNYSMQIQFFSRLETKELLDGYLSNEEIDQVYDFSSGMPGYISELIRQLKEGNGKEEILNNLPTSFNLLLENTWSNYNFESDYKKLIALIIYSPEKLTVSIISEILSLNEYQIYSIVDDISFISLEDEKITLINPYRIFLINKLSEIKNEILQLMIDYYEKSPLNNSSLTFLPEIYKEANKFGPLVDLVNIDYIYNTVQKSRNISSVRNNLKILSQMSYTHKDWQSLSWSNLADSVFNQIASGSPAVENQLKSLLALNRYEDALQIAYACILPEDRLLLLSHICNYMKHNGINISPELLDSIKELINLIDATVDLNKELIEKLINISSNIFSVDAALSINLLDRIVSKSGENIEKDKLMDYLLIRLLARVDNSNNDIDHITNNIGDNDVQDYIKITSDIFNLESIDEILSKVELINDVSAKLFYLENWCYKNKDNSEAFKIVEYALNIMIENNQYTPTQMHLRNFAEALEKTKESSVAQKLIEKIDNLSATIIKNPIDEYASVELALAKIEKKWSKDAALERYFKVYFLLEDVYDNDSKCLILVRLLDSLEDIMDNDPKLKIELRDQLIMDYSRLINASAEHFKVTRKIIQRLTKIDKNLALNFAGKLNTNLRRYRVYSEILKVHVKEHDIDFVFINQVIDLINEKPLLDRVLLQLLKKLVESEKFVDSSIKRIFFGTIKDIDSVQIKALSFAYYMNWMKEDVDKYTSAFEEMKNCLDKIDATNEKRELGFRLVQIISENHNSFAEQLYKKVIENYVTNNIFDTRLSEPFIEIVNLMIRMVPDILKSQDYKFKIRMLKNIILTIPSSYHQASLLSNIALRCSANDNNELINEITEKCLDILDNCKEDVDTSRNIILEISPLLYLYEKSILFERVNTLESDELRDIAIRNVMKYLITKRPPEDPLDFEMFQQKINYSTAIKICELIDNLNVDINIYASIKTLIESLVERQGQSNKLISKIKERQLLEIVTKIKGVIDTKLPDKNNIKHEGYKIAAFGSLALLRDIASFRAMPRWNSIIPSREDLEKNAKLINNTSDKIFVLAALGKNALYENSSMGDKLIKEAEMNLKYLNNPLDRIERHELIVESYQKISNNKAAKYLLEQAIGLAKSYADENGRDQMLGGLVELAHTIDPNLAQNIASKLESIENLSNYNDRLKTLTLHSDPQKIKEYSPSEINEVLHDFYKKMVRTLCSSRGTIQHDEVIGESLKHSAGKSFETIALGLSWYVENIIARTKNHNESSLDDFFMRIYQLLELIRNVETTMYNKDNFHEANFYKVLSATNIQTFDLNQQEDAFSLIQQWINNNVGTYLKIYDPYFDVNMLNLLKQIGNDSRIFIYSSTKSANLEKLPDLYKAHWKSICDNVPPETHIYMLATGSGSSPLHDRFIISDSAGMNLGTSLNGYGSKISSIKFLDYDEKKKIENEIIDSAMIMPPTKYKEEKVFLKMFTLNN